MRVNQLATGGNELKPLRIIDDRCLKTKTV